MVDAAAQSYSGSELLDHRAGMPAPGDQDLAAELARAGLGPLLDAAFGEQKELRARFEAALLHYARAARVVIPPNGSATSPDPSTVPDLMPDAELPGAPESAVVLAVFDEALPLARPEITSRLASHWEMGASQLGAVPFGTEVTGAALAAAAPSALHRRGAAGLYATFGLNDMGLRSGRRLHRLRSHGASVLGLATAPNLDRQHPLIGVGLPAEVVMDTSGALLPFYVLAGVLFAVARTRRLSAQIAGGSKGAAQPALGLVVMVSYGVLSGPKDGSDPMTRALDALCAPGRAALPGLGPVHVVWPMGNGRQVRSHAILAPDADPLGLMLLPDDRTPSFVALRAPAAASGAFGLRAGLSLPGSDAWVSTPAAPSPGTRARIELGHGRHVTAYFARETPAGGDDRDMILLAFGPTASRDPAEPPLPAGRWRLRIEAAAGPVTLFVQRDDSLEALPSGGRQARFDDPAYRRWDDAGREILRDPGGSVAAIRRWRTVNAFATGSHAWRVGGRFTCGDEVPYSGLGAEGDPLSEGDGLAVTDRGPSLAGVPVRSLLEGAGLRESGTSVAVPQFGRALAMTMAKHRAGTGDWPDRTTLAARLARLDPPEDGQARR